MKYYKVILPNNEIKYINSHNFIWYSSKLNTFIGGNEFNSEYIIVDNEIYRVPWLKYEPIKTRGQYPEVNVGYVTEDEYYNHKLEQENIE